jgi:hypothetical protein
MPLPLIATRESYAFRVTNDAHPAPGRATSQVIVSNVAKLQREARHHA